jgi:hypothetical protein
VPSAVPPSFGDAALRDRRAEVPPIGAALYRWRSAPEPTARRRPAEVRSGGSRVHSPPSPLRFPPATGSLGRRTTGTRPVHSPFFAMSAESRVRAPLRQGRSGAPVRSRCRRGPAGSDTGGTSDRTSIARRERTAIRARRSRSARVDTGRTGRPAVDWGASPHGNAPLRIATPGDRPASASAAFTAPRASSAEPEPAEPAASEGEPE